MSRENKRLMIERRIKNIVEGTVDLSNLSLFNEDIEYAVMLLNQKPNIVTLDLSYNSFDDKCIPHLAKLEYFKSMNLCHTDISGKEGALRPLLTNPRIIYLDVGNCNLTRDAYEDIQKYTAQEAMRFVHNQRLEQSYEVAIKAKLAENKQKKASAISVSQEENLLPSINQYGSLFGQIPKGSNLPDCPIQKGELRDSFHELIESTIECVTQSTKKEWLFAILANPECAPIEVMKYSLGEDITVGARLVIIYCGLYPEKWEDEYMKKEYYSPTILSFLSRSQKILKNELETELKQYLQKLIKDIFKINDINLDSIPVEVKQESQKKLTEYKAIADDISEQVEEDIKNLIQEKESLEKTLIKEREGGNTFISPPPSPRKFIAAAQNEIPSNTLQTLTPLSPIWKQIFALPSVSWTCTGRKRNEMHMFSVVRDILYRETTALPWSKLPHSSTVRYYYYQWRTDGTLVNILNCCNYSANAPLLT